MTEPTHRPGRGALIAASRIAAGLVGLAVAAATVGAATFLPLPTISVDTRDTTINPTAANQQRVCAGPLLRLGDERGLDTIPNGIGQPGVRYDASDGTPRAATIETPDTSGGTAPQSITLAPTGDAVAHFAASQAQAIDFAGLRGLAAASCDTPASDVWLVGGDTTTGRTTILTLANPSTVVSSVDLELYTEAGRVRAAGAEGIVVPPGSQRILSLAGFVPDAVSPVIRVTSNGGTVVAHLQQSTTRTLDPGGVEIIGAGVAPSTRIVIPGYTVVDHEAIEDIGLGPGFEDLASVLRVLAPGTDDPHLRLSVIADAEPAANPIAVDLAAGRVTDLFFDHLTDGVYTLIIDSTVPIVAGARTSTAAGDTIDLGWFTSAPELRDDALVAVAPGPSAALHLANASELEQTATVTDPAGTRIVVTVPARGGTSIPVTPGLTYTVTGFAELHLAVSYQQDAGLASFPVTGPSALQTELRVAR